MNSQADVFIPQPFLERFLWLGKNDTCMRTQAVLVLVVLFSLFAIRCTDKTHTSSAGVQYDSKIFREFWTNSEVHVLVRLVDNSNITIEGTNDERAAKLVQRDEWFKPVIDEVLSTLPESEIRDVSRRSNGFSGYITKQGFDILLDNPHVRKISSTTGGTDLHVTLDEPSED